MKKLFYFDLNSIHNYAEKSLKDYNKEQINWFSNITDINVDVVYTWLDLLDYNLFTPLHEITKPFYDYYKKYHNFNIFEISKLYRPQQISINQQIFNQIIAKTDSNIEYIKKIKPDIIFLRYYYGYEFLIYYILDQLKDVKSFKSIGGNVVDYVKTFYIQDMLDENILDNYHEGYGEEHLKNILDGKNIGDFTSNHNFTLDDFSIPDNETHWIVTTPYCNGTCKFCSFNTDYKSKIKSKINFSSEEYINFLINRLKWFESQNVKYIDIATSISFFNYSHLELFYNKYKESNLTISFIDSYFKMVDFNIKSTRMLKEMNFKSVKIGLEHINSDIRKKLGKGFSNELINETIKNLKENDISFKFSFLFNIPFENINHMIENYNFILNNNINYFALNRYHLIEGTDIYDNYSNYNLKKGINEDGYEFFKRIIKIPNNSTRLIHKKINSKFNDNYKSEMYEKNF